MNITALLRPTSCLTIRWVAYRQHDVVNNLPNILTFWQFQQGEEAGVLRQVHNTACQEVGLTYLASHASLLLLQLLLGSRKPIVLIVEKDQTEYWHNIAFAFFNAGVR